MKATLRAAALAALLVVSHRGLAASQAAPLIHLDVDAREISRALLHARLEIPAAPGELVLWYPKWIPGVHAPAGPVQNLAGLRFETVKGEPIPWRRDEEEMCRFLVTVPPGAGRVVAKLDYICNQPSVNSSGVDSFGNSLLGVINWNTVLLYPENASIDALHASLRLQLPAGWRFGTALRLEHGPAGSSGGANPHASRDPEPSKARTVEFAAEPLRRLVDCPLICGEHFRTIELTGKNTPPAFLHLTSEAPSAIQIDDKLIAQYRKLVVEAVSLFGGARFDAYHFLVVCSDSLPRNGLEHLSSSFNEVGERELVDEKKRKSWPAYLLPHEFVHSWCGKFRRPASMVTTNFHQPERTRLLWIYEGLTQYLGEVLTVRAGLLTLEEHLPALANKVDYLIRQAGRRWRPLEDTAVASWLNRAHSQSWAQLRRGQDYYDEGLVIWLEADALIRERTGGRKSLDDFCRKFFDPRATGVPPVNPGIPTNPGASPAVRPEVVGYELKEVTAALREVVEEDWDKFFAERISKPKDALGLEFLTKTLGYRLQYSAKPSEYLTEREKERKQVVASASIGLIAGEDGKINTVIPGSPADKAALAGGMTFSGVIGCMLISERLRV
ncbi:MAG: hypothetical protein M3463_13180, partial [Verrucomicrobiota bacterium]|nr:hypothetical protein [Verrucomicrobiota bacterium]